MTESLYSKETQPRRLPDFNDYFVKGRTTGDNRYFSDFLTFYEPVLDRKIDRFLGQYLLPQDRKDDLKQTAVSVLWEQYLSYDPASPLPLLQLAKPKITRALQQYVSENCYVTDCPSEKEYRAIRRVSRLYYEMRTTGTDSEAVTENISAKLKMRKNHVRELIRIAETWKYSCSIIENDTDPGTDIPEDYSPESSAQNDTIDISEIDFSVSESTEPDHSAAIRHAAFVHAAENLNTADQLLLKLTDGVDMVNWKTTIPVPPEKAALLLGYADASAVEKKRQRVLDTLTAGLCEYGYLDAVRMEKKKAPVGEAKGKQYLYYAYQPKCQGKAGMIRFDTDTGEYSVINSAEEDINLRYAGIVAKKIKLFRKKREVPALKRVILSSL